MHIHWLGLNAFRIQHEGTVIITNPCDAAQKFRINKQTATILINSTSVTKDVLQTITGKPFVIDSPGEYEVNSIFVYGVPADGGTLYLLTMQDLSVAFIGTIKQKELSPVQLEIVEDADILIIPIGGGNVTTGAEAAHIINQVEPRLVIPAYYSTKKSSKLDSLDTFLKEYSAPQEVVDKLKVVKKDLIKEETKVVILKG